MNDPQLIPLPYLSTAEIWLTGRWGEGGLAIVQDGGRQATLVLPPALFNLLAVLILAAKRSDSDGAWPARYLSVVALGRELARRTQGTENLLLPDPQHVIRYVYRTRNLLAKAIRQMEPAAAAETPDCQEWAKQLLEYRAFFGYRLSTSPERLRLVILDELADDFSVHE